MNDFHNQKEIFKTISLITQLGISIMVPIFLMVFLATYVKDKFGKDFIIVFVILGVCAGIRNAYVILKVFLDDIKHSSKKDSELIKKHKRYLEEHKYEK